MKNIAVALMIVLLFNLAIVEAVPYKVRLEVGQTMKTTCGQEITLLGVGRTENYDTAYLKFKNTDGETIEKMILVGHRTYPLFNGRIVMKVPIVIQHNEAVIEILTCK